MDREREGRESFWPAQEKETGPEQPPATPDVLRKREAAPRQKPVTPLEREDPARAKASRRCQEGKGSGEVPAALPDEGVVDAIFPRWAGSAKEESQEKECWSCG